MVTKRHGKKQRQHAKAEPTQTTSAPTADYNKKLEEPKLEKMLQKLRTSLAGWNPKEHPSTNESLIRRDIIPSQFVPEFAANILADITAAYQQYLPVDTRLLDPIKRFLIAFD